MKVLLFGDAPMALNEGGINQTLYNLFCFIKPEDFLGITEVDLKSLEKIGSTEPYTKRYRSYKLNAINIPVNKLTKFSLPLISSINYFLFKHNNYQKLRREIELFNPDVVISCSNTASGILMHDKLLKNSKYPIIPYFMDDWMYKVKADRIGNLVSNIIKEMLQNNRNWMMIGEELGNILAERYQAKPEKILYVRNPVDLTDAPKDNPYVKNGPFTIAYAGALWPMHFDSFLAFAKAVKSLAVNQNIQLMLYTQEGQWSWRKSELESLGVKYGGHLPYNQIHQKLNEADALLITASFSSENYTHSKASLQTKITDYCKSKRLIISCGPTYSANNHFIKENNCGVCIETIDEKEIANQLSKIIVNINNYQNYVSNAWDTLYYFSKETVHQKIKSFLTEIAFSNN
ncbi:glycosyltransferase family protein [Mucilaginibacter arboris]|uniref:Glycosyltransferase n=1 Tax=Mucilaginibacter arboris TaxID=2682090 RepID=A0A7K1SY38_9SPHI|nr:glycosyltransferase [Mucilaginibacter arboris]MVN22232.1 glycosyltransferase [Mucilaginibacter arboris]